VPEKIKVILKRVFVKDSADWLGSGEFYFNATVDGKPVGDKQIFDAREGTWIALPAAKWSAIVDVTSKTQVAMRFNGKDEDVFSDDDLGTVSYTLRPPWKQFTHRQDTQHFTLEWEVQLLVDGNYGRHPPNEVFACRTAGGNANCTTVSGVPIIARMEIHPVRPVPTPLPPRGLPAGPLNAVTNTAGSSITSLDPINIVPNPAVIPILSSPGAAVAAGAPPTATADTAARIEVTFYRPNTLAFTPSDPRLEWTARPISGGAVAFVGPARGLNVLVYGTAPGEVALELRFRGELMATYRALVMRVKQIPCRFNILNGPTAASRPRVTPTDVVEHLAIANRLLRQVALELVLDTNTSRRHGAVATTTPGIFRIAVNRGVTFHIDSDASNVPATLLNYRPGVMNFAYIHSERRANIGGAATDFPNSTIPAAAPARPSITDSGSPSTSWISPTGVPPDGAAGTVTMNLIRGIQRRGHPRLFAMFIADNLGNPATPADQQVIAGVICHELGHILNLGHRVEGPDPTTATGLNANGIFFDGLTHPPVENVMNWTALQTAQDFDIIQARAVHRSPLVPP
jgi:hypothetical protein